MIIVILLDLLRQTTLAISKLLELPAFVFTHASLVEQRDNFMILSRRILIIGNFYDERVYL